MNVQDMQTVLLNSLVRTNPNNFLSILLKEDGISRLRNRFLNKEIIYKWDKNFNSIRDRYAPQRINLLLFKTFDFIDDILKFIFFFF